MKIAIDIDNMTDATADMIEFISVLSNLLITDHTVYILSASVEGSEQDIAVELDLYDIDYSDIIITGDKVEFVQRNKVSIVLSAGDVNICVKTARMI